MRGLPVLFLSIVISACGSPSSEPADLAVATDLAMSEDDLSSRADLSSSGELALASDLLAVGGSDGGPIAGPAPDGGFCHGYGWGAPAVSFTTVATLPTMTGGTIALGAYDAVSVTTTSSLMGSYRATWVFGSASAMYIYEQLSTGSGTPPTPVPKTLTWSTAGDTLSRQQTCGGSTSFSNGYTLRNDSSGTYLDVRSGNFVFTFKKRP